jgi:hypothetical protein
MMMKLPVVVANADNRAVSHSKGANLVLLGLYSKNTTPGWDLKKRNY